MKENIKPKRVNNVENLDKEETISCSSTADDDQKEEKAGMIGGVTIQLLVDSGADANLINPDAWEMMKIQNVRVKSSTKGSTKVLKGYANDKPLTIIGSFIAEIVVGKMKTDAEFFVVQGGQRDILGDGAAKKAWCSESRFKCK